MNRILVLLIILILPLHLFSQSFLDDLTTDNGLSFEIDNSSNITKDLSTDTLPLTDILQNGKKFSLGFYLTMGRSGSKDFLNYSTSFSFRFSSKSRHSLSLQFSHTGLAPGVFTSNFTYLYFNVAAGVLYLYKIFSYDEGFFLYSTVGGSLRGASLSFGLGVGSLLKNGFSIEVNTMVGSFVGSVLRFSVYALKALALEGKIGFDVIYENKSISFFSFYMGLYLGFFVKETVRCLLGGGGTVDDYGKWSGFGGIIFQVQFPRYSF